LITIPNELSKNWEAHNIFTETEDRNLTKACLDAVNRLKLIKVKKLLHETTQNIESLGDNHDSIFPLLEDKMQLEKIKMQLAQYFGTVIL
jgi:hypothetical protein